MIPKLDMTETQVHLKDSNEAECGRVHPPNVVVYTRLRYPDGGVVGNRGAATGLGQGPCPKPVLPVYSFQWLGDDYFFGQNVLNVLAICS